MFLKEYINKKIYSNFLKENKNKKYINRITNK